MAIRLLFLHGLRGSPSSKRLNVIKKAGNWDVLEAPNLGTRSLLILYTLSLVLLTLVCSAVTAYAIYKESSSIIIFIHVCLSILVIKVSYSIGGRIATYFMLKKAVSRAEDSFKKIQPNVIIGSSFGSVVALLMNVPKVSLILLAPAQYLLSRYLHMKKFPSLDYFPYVLIVHDDSIHFVEDNSFANCKLEVVEDDHSLKSLNENDFKEYIEEAYLKGRFFITMIHADEIEQLSTITKDGRKEYTINPRLFDLEINNSKNDTTQIENDTVLSTLNDQNIV